MRQLILGMLLAGVAGCHESTTSHPQPTDAGLLPPGRACDGDEQCQSGFCIEFLAGRACAATCAGECGADMICKHADARNPSSTAICVPAALHPSRLCSLCEVDSDCDLYGDLCLPRDGRLYCGLDCSETNSCPEGYACHGVRDDAGAEIARQCEPTLGTCTCSALTAGLKRPCTKVVAGIGTCMGEETCDGVAGWVSCDARTPVLERCDNADNDCDSLVDEDPSGGPLTEVCGYGPEPRRAECSGVRSCVEGGFDACDVAMPAANDSVCNGLDDDCDGFVDEDALYTADHCASCADVCPPGPGNTTAVRSCVANGAQHFCGAIKCIGVNYDVNGDENDGCEVSDDYLLSGSVVQLHDQWYTALLMSPTALECYDDSTPIQACGFRIPSDDRQHVPANPTAPSVDYFIFHADNAWDCSMQTWVCANFSSVNEAPLPAIEVCVSDPVDNVYTEPTFSWANCTTVTGLASYRAEIPSDISDTAYLYIRVRSPMVGGSHYGGTYGVAAYDSAGRCPLGTAADLCTY